jgi:hypothetical protein
MQNAYPIVTMPELTEELIAEGMARSRRSQTMSG